MTTNPWKDAAESHRISLPRTEEAQQRQRSRSPSSISLVYPFLSLSLNFFFLQLYIFLYPQFLREQEEFRFCKRVTIVFNGPATLDDPSWFVSLFLFTLSFLSPILSFLRLFRSSLVLLPALSRSLHLSCQTTTPGIRKRRKRRKRKTRNLRRRRQRRRPRAAC